MTKFLKFYIPIYFLILAGGWGCTYSGAALGVVESKGAVAIEQKRQYNDIQAEFLSVAPCDITVGAYHRVLNDLEKGAVDVLCGGDLEHHVTADDVQSIRDFIELLESSRNAVNKSSTN